MSGALSGWSDGWSGRVDESEHIRPAQDELAEANDAESFVSYAAAHTRGRPRTGLQRVRQSQVDAARAAITERDEAVLRELARVRVLSGNQLERLLFADIAPSARSRVRRRVLRRLIDWRLVTTLERRIGGVRAGSAGLIHALDSGGARLLASQVHHEEPPSDSPRLRRPTTPGSRFLHHALSVSELYVGLREAERLRSARWQLVTFQAEPACWWPDGLGGTLKPDAYVLLRSQSYEHAWWIEIDLATESLPTLSHKLERYGDFYARGGTGPDGVMPRVLLSVSEVARVNRLDSLPVASQPSRLIVTAPSDRAVEQLASETSEEEET